MAYLKPAIRVGRPAARLVSVTARGDGESVVLAKPMMLIGSGAGVHVRLHTRTVDDIHAILLNTDGRIYLRDLASQSGVVVNGTAVREAYLRDRDHLQIGKVVFRLDAGPLPLDERCCTIPPAELQHHTGDIAIIERVVLIGRGEGCDVRIDDETCSEKHAIVFAADGCRHLRVLTPGPHTLLNNAKVRRATLSDGDRLFIGQRELRYTQPAVPATTPTAPATVATDASAVEYPVDFEPDQIAPPSSDTGPADVAIELSNEEEFAASDPAEDDGEGSSTQFPAPMFDSAVDLETVRGWGPLAVAIATAQGPNVASPDEGSAGLTEPDGASRWDWRRIAVISAAVILIGVSIAAFMWWRGASG